MKNKTRLSMRHRTTKRQIVIASILGSLMGVMFSGGFAFSSVRNFFITIVWSAAIWISQWLGHGYIYELVDRWFGWKRLVVARILTHILMSVAYASLGVAFISWLGYYALSPDQAPSFLSILEGVWVIASLIALAISLIMATIGFFKAMEAAIIERENLRSQMLSYKYELLRNQINPHFLFNSLNVLTSLVEEEPSLAVRFIRQLSEVYRYVLDNQHQELVPLMQERDFIQSYIFLLKIRFEDALDVSLNIDQSNLNRAVVPMSLQLLVENAVKHNEVSTSRPLSLEITTESDYLVVKNNKQVRKQTESSSKIGLKNLRQSLEHFTERRMLIEDTPSSFLVRVPLLDWEEREMVKKIEL